MENSLLQNSQPQFDSEVLGTPNNLIILKFTVVGLFVLLPVVGLSGYYFGKQSTSSTQTLDTTSKSVIATASPSATTEKGNQVACTMEAKICPDGSSVGRSGPNCEFSECPSTIKLKEHTNGTQTFTSSIGYSFTFPTKYQPSRISDRREELLIDGNCSISFTQGGMGHITSSVVPYKEGPLKDFYLSLSTTHVQGYIVQYEEVMVSGKKGLMVERGPAGDSGSGTDILVPFNNDHVFIISISYLGKDNPEVRSILKSIELNKLNISQCGK